MAELSRPISPICTAADLPRGEGRSGALLFLLRRALPAGLPDRDRHSAVHPPDRRRQPHRGGEDHFRLQHHGRHVRPRLPDRNAVRGSVRARGGGGEAGRDRPIAALRDRSRRSRPGNRPMRAGRRPASGWRSSARGLRAWLARMSLAIAGVDSDDLRTAREGGRPQRIRHRRLQDGRRFRRPGGRFHSLDRRHRDSARAGARPRRQARRPAARLRRGLPRHGPRLDQQARLAAGDRTRERDRRCRLYCALSGRPRTFRRCRSAGGSW